MSLINLENEENEVLYVYGSGEMDQLSPVKEDEKNEDIFDSKIPLIIPLHFISPQEKIQTIKCGQMFTMVLSTEGNVYTFGCADNGGIGHEDSIPAKIVNINFKAKGISGGDCHGLAYNDNKLAFWGQFRNSQGGIGEPCLDIKYYNNEDINNEFYNKVISGTNHVLILTKSKNIYSFGNKEFGQRGIDPKLNIGHLVLNKINENDVEDIFTGDEHSFLIKKERNSQIVKSWGLNTKGQLGIGFSSLDGDEYINIYIPTKINFSEGIKIKKIRGGSGTSIALSEDNRVFVWGGNDDNLLGLNTNEIVINKPKELMFFNKFLNPNNEVDEIVSSYQSFYARNKNNNNVYSWGSGDNYILGNRKEKAEKNPYLIESKFYKFLKVADLDMGCAHVAVVLTKADRLYDNEKRVNIIDKQPNSNKGIKATKRKNENLPGENEKKLNECEDNFSRKKEFRIREEYITLDIKDKPKTKSKISNGKK